MDDRLMPAVGGIIRRLRKERGLTQEVLSGFACVARSHLAMIERGQKSPNLETLSKIAGALNLRVSELIALAEQEAQNPRA